MKDDFRLSDGDRAIKKSGNIAVDDSFRIILKQQVIGQFRHASGIFV